ncbi:MAG: ribulose-bisphosphate carboxylase large subunit family protein [Chloroflexota bacterium]|nr:ribulose-bisphosphate carboxylase large subunit family protein [Chloroflexota bacterium]
MHSPLLDESISDRIFATYHIETAHPLEQAAAIMAGEQSAGTFVKVPGETPELLEQHGARVERITELDSTDVPALPGSRPPKGSPAPRYQRAEVVLSFPFANIGTSLTACMTAVSGNLYELSPFSGLRLLDVEFPPAFIAAHPGPAFGVEGTRRLTGVRSGPMLGTIIKPSVGLSPTQTAALVQTLCDAGLDFIKDDELQSNAPHSPLTERVQAVMGVINAFAERTGKRVMYAFNVTGDLDTIKRGHDTVLAHGGTCIMVNLIPVGLTAVEWLRRNSQLPIHGHRAGWGALSRHLSLGWEYRAFQKFFRLAGVDHLHVNGLRNKFCESDESVMTAARACLTPMAGGYTALPVFSSGQWAGQAPDTYAALGSTDLLYLAGGGIMAHPDGPAAGVASLREAWDAALSGISLDEYARTHPALRGALEMYGAL